MSCGSFYLTECLAQHNPKIEPLADPCATRPAYLFLFQIAVDYLEGAVRRLGQHNASLASQLEKALEAAPHKQPRLVAPPPSAQPSAPPAAEAAAAPDADGDAQCAVDASAQMKRAGVGDAVDLQLVAAPAAPPVSPRTLQRVLRAASRVHEKNKQLKVALEAMECAQQRQQKQQP